MSDTDKRERGERWYDAHRVTLALFVTLSICFGWWGSLVFATARAAEVKNVEQDARLNGMDAKLDRIDGKLDRLLENRK